MKENISLRELVYKYIKNKYNCKPEYLWKKFPDYAVFRNKYNHKWFSIVMNVKKSVLCFDSDKTEYLDIINIKCDPLLKDLLIEEEGYFPAYHMNKVNWLTIILDKTADINEVYKMIDMSYEIVDNKK